MQFACEEERACVCSLTCTVLCPGLAAIWMRAAKQRQKLFTKNSFFDAFCDESLCIITKTIYDWRRIVCGSLFQRQHLGEAGTSKRFRQCNIWSKKSSCCKWFCIIAGHGCIRVCFSARQIRRQEIPFPERDHTPVPSILIDGVCACVYVV